METTFVAASVDDPRAFGDGILDVLDRPGEHLVGAERPHVGLLVERIAHAGAFVPLDERLDELVAHLELVDEILSAAMQHWPAR